MLQRCSLSPAEISCLVQYSFVILAARRPCEAKQSPLVSKGWEDWQNLRKFGCIFSKSLQNPRKSLKRTWHKISLFPDSFMPLSKRHIAGQVGRSQGFSWVSWNRRWRRHRRWWHWWGWDGRGSWTCHWGLPKFGSQWMQLPFWEAYGLMDVDKCDFFLILSWFVSHRLPRYLQRELHILLIMQSNVIIWHG